MSRVKKESVLKAKWKKKSKGARIAICAAAALALLFTAGFPLGAKVKSDYLSMMRSTVLETSNNATDKFLAKANLTDAQAPAEAVSALLNTMKGNVKYIPDSDDYSKTPDEFMRDRGGDCEDFAVFVSYALTRANVSNRIVVRFSLFGHAYNEFLNASGEWERLDFLDKPYVKYFTNKSYFRPTEEFNKTADSIGNITNPAQRSPTKGYSKMTETFGAWFRENVLYYLLSPYYSTEKIEIS